MRAIEPGNAELRAVKVLPAGWVEYVGPEVYAPDGTTLFMTPQVAPPYLVEWSAQAQADWIEVNGGDPVLTNRDRAKGQGIDGGSPLSVGQRAEMSERNQDHNKLMNRVIFLENVVAAMMVSTGGTENVRADAIAESVRSRVDFDATPIVLEQTADAITHFPQSQRRQKSNARQQLRDAIDAGDGDS